MVEKPTCIRDQSHGLSEVVRLLTLFLEVLAGAAGLIFLFSGVAISQLWNGWTWRTCSKKESPACSPRPAPLKQRLEKEAGESSSWTRGEAGRWRSHPVLNMDSES
jgi:hypothetical protein